MSLIPYHPREGREILLRHHNSVVVRDPDSHRLEIRGAECPTCHQPLGGSSSPEPPYERPYELSHEYVNPDYFRMLRERSPEYGPTSENRSPLRRLFRPALASHSPPPPSSSSATASSDVAESSSEQLPVEGSRIRRDAFSPNYFKTFFVEERVLGRGGKGVVLLVRHEIDGCQLGHFACKRVPVGDDHAWLEKVLVEVELLAKLSHPNLVSYRHAWLEDVQLTRFGPSVACAFILQQYCDSGDLHQYVVGGAPREATTEELKAQMRRRSKGQSDLPPNKLPKRPQLSFEVIYSLFKDITSGVAHLHAANYIHRDLKPSNCLLHKQGGRLSCLISDFGEVQPENVARKSTGSTGTISYCAPEVLRLNPSTGRYGNFTTKSDMFSLGMILYFMSFERLPYHGANAIQEELEDMELLRAEISAWKGFREERWQRSDLPTKLYKLLKRLLAVDPSERPSAIEVLAAMKNEPSIDGVNRIDRSPASASGLRGSRIQNLDPPTPSGTSKTDLRRERRAGSRLSSSPDDMRAWSAEDIAQPRQGAGSVDPMPRSGTSQRFRRALVPGRDLGDRPEAREIIDDESRPGENVEESLGPPLLMPPPRSTGSEMWYQLELALRRASLGMVPGRDFTYSVVRLGIFLLKLSTLARPCWPYAAKLEVSIPLVVAAALDLGFPRWLSMSETIRQRHQPIGVLLLGKHILIRNLGTSLALLALHFLVLWIARRWGALCVAASQDDWALW